MSTLQQTMESRKAVIPLVQKMLEGVRDAFSKAIALQQDMLSEQIEKLLKREQPILVQPPQVIVDTTKLEQALEKKQTITVQAPDVKVTTPKTQQITGSIESPSLKKALTTVQEKVEKVESRLVAVASTLEKLLKQQDERNSYLDSRGLAVRIVEQDLVVNTASSGKGNTDDRVWLREQYTYTTISGMQVPTQVQKWSHNSLLTETYEYNGDAKPIKKFRRLEPIT